MEALKGKVAVVTGASEGIGEAIVRRLAAEGMKVAALARRAEKLATLETGLKGKGYFVKGYICDVQSESDVKAAFKSIEEDFGAVSVLVNNAGILRFMETSAVVLEDATAMINTNVLGVLLCCREGIASMKTHSVDRGHIINLNSVAGQRIVPYDTLSLYSASKHAVTTLNHSLRNELKPHKIRVTSISPGLVKTSMADQIHKDLDSNLPFMLPRDVVDAVIYALGTPTTVNVTEIILDTTGWS